MSSRSRIQYTPSSASSGGGGAPTIGEVAWGPDFGESSGNDDNTWTARVAADLSAVTLTNDKTVNVALDITTLALDNSDTANVAVDFADLNLTNDDTANVALDITNLALINDDTANVAVDITDLTLVNDDTANVALAGSVVSAPFYQGAVSNSGTSVGAGTLTINMPSGSRVNDLIIAVVADSAVAASIGTVESGWTEEISLTGTTFTKVYRRFATASEPPNYGFSMGGTGTVNFSGALFLIRGVDQTTPINVSATTNDASATDPVVPTATTTVNNCFLIAVAHQTPLTSDTNTWPAGWTERVDVVGGTASVSHLGVATRYFLTAGATGTVTVNSGTLAAATYDTIMLAIAPGTITLPS